jgi:membrane-bound inhibitor of C-type lysozyme
MIVNHVTNSVICNLIADTNAKQHVTTVKHVGHAQQRSTTNYQCAVIRYALHAQMIEQNSSVVIVVKRNLLADINALPNVVIVNK